MRLILFDCDGTLADSQHMIIAAMRDGFAACGLEPPTRRRILHTVGLSPVEAMAELAPAGGPEDHAALAEAYRQAFRALRGQPGHAEPLFPGARAAIETLAARPDIFLGIATGKSRRGVDILLRREGLEGRFATIQTADDAPSKPHPAMVLNALAETGAAAEEAAMIGDSVHDMAMARNAGVQALGVAWGYHAPDALKAAGANAVARDFDDLLALLAPAGLEDAA